MKTFYYLKTTLAILLYFVFLTDNAGSVEKQLLWDVFADQELSWDFYVNFLEYMDEQRQNIDSNALNISMNWDGNNSAGDWAKTKPQNWDFDPNQCAYVQQGVSYWQHSDSNMFINLSIIKMVTHFLDPNYPPIFTCGGYVTLSREQLLKECDEAKLGVYVYWSNDKRGKGDRQGVQVWVFLYFDVPEYLLPVTETVPPDPELTTKAAFLNVSLKN